MGAGRLWERVLHKARRKVSPQGREPPRLGVCWKNASLSRGNATMNPWGQPGAPTAYGRHLSLSLMTGALGYGASFMPDVFCDLG